MNFDGISWISTRRTVLICGCAIENQKNKNCDFFKKQISYGESANKNCTTRRNSPNSVEINLIIGSKRGQKTLPFAVVKVQFWPKIQFTSSRAAFESGLRFPAVFRESCFFGLQNSLVNTQNSLFCRVFLLICGEFDSNRSPFLGCFPGVWGFSSSRLSRQNSNN